jgi:hypothetical protein
MLEGFQTIENDLFIRKIYKIYSSGAIDTGASLQDYRRETSPRCFT